MKYEVKKYNVRKAVITVSKKPEPSYRGDLPQTVDVVLYGGATATAYDGIQTLYLEGQVRRWQEQVGKTGMVDVGNGHFIPLHLVENIKITYAEHYIDLEVPIPSRFQKFNHNFIPTIVLLIVAFVVFGIPLYMGFAHK